MTDEPTSFGVDGNGCPTEIRRGLFTVGQAMARIVRPDMTSRCGAHLLHALLSGEPSLRSA